ncbi:NAD-dependent epimerase/dehydratase family protein [Pseudomonas sp. EYE_354]|uniref:NAD-dependent epimerase/dehydratase family protein n=1 Tax=Pseudomonas sp. EYE_354 TaxID=2853449 RepID=UPI002006A86F|nr:NAD-dependent epimerase/dehydratase family protein [Pseudomonas sp. EYE_354]MCK6186787.1 NAD-dependent epimerase/dehydratase family protein [Pseudomonas sp. EYE_354]
MKKILLTGATGFVGSALLNQLLKQKKYSTIIATRSSKSDIERSCQVFNVGNFSSSTSWNEVMNDVECVIHTAGRAHVLKHEDNALELFRETNTEATLNLAKQAAALGVKRFIFISSIGVNGAHTYKEPFSDTSKLNPQTDYAISKREAETGLLQIADNSQMEVVIIRPPLVYAAHAPGNFRRLLKLVRSGLPLPLGKVHNARSMIALENLVDFICLCIEHKNASNQIFLISDGQNFSTRQIAELLAEGMGRKALLLPIPLFFLKALAILLGKQRTYTQLCESLEIDSSKCKSLLGWTPSTSPELAIIDAGKKFMRAP